MSARSIYYLASLGSRNSSEEDGGGEGAQIPPSRPRWGKVDKSLTTWKHRQMRGPMDPEGVWREDSAPLPPPGLDAPAGRETAAVHRYSTALFR